MRSERGKCEVPKDSAWHPGGTLDVAMVLVGQCFEKLMSITSVMPSNHPILLIPSPALNLSQHQGLFQ